MTDKHLFDTYNPTQEELIANAPEGATHYTEENEDWYLTYWKYEPLADKWVHRTANSSWWNDAYSYEFDKLKAKGLVKSIEGGIVLEEEVLVKLSEDDPISIRNRILEIRKQRSDGIDEEEKLVNQLAALGFQIIEQMNQKLEDVKEQHDLQDPKNWKVGDLVERVNGDCPEVYTVGNLYEVEQEHPKLCVYDNFGGKSSCLIHEEDYDNFKFHSRPSK